MFGIRCLGCGEVGLNYERERDSVCRRQQEVLLAAMVQKAKATSKPLLLHIRDQEGETIASDQ